MTDSKKTDTKTQWSDDDYEVDRCHHILKLLAYASVVGLLIICIGIGIAILVNQNGGATTITSVRSKSSPPKVPPTLKQEEVHVPEPPKDNQLVAQAEDLNPAGRLVPPKSPMAKVPACEPALVFTPPQIKLVGTISSHVSPDPADGSFNLFTLNLTMTIINANISQPLLDGNRLVINVSEPYRANWPQLDGLGRTWSVQHLSGNHHRYSLSITASAKNVQPGFYENLTLAVSQIRTLNPKLSCPMVLLHYIKVSIDVTCSATILDKWCDGERRWIPKSNKCVKTYKPCGQELTVGVPNTNPCTRYACYNNNRTCSQVPLGGIGSGQCDSCTPVSICTPNCTNIYNEQGGITGDLIRYCGDDGCGGICGIPDTANGCDPVGIAHSCDALFGKCVASTLGSCSLPYNLFMGSIAVGNPRLNALDLDGLQSWVLTNNDTSTTDPIHLVTADDPLTLGNELSPWNAVYGWPLDERTVPLQGIRVRIFLNSFYYPDTITNSDNAPGTSDVNFKFTVAPGQIRAMEAYICGQDGDTSNGGRDTFLALVREDCTEFNTTDINFTPADQYQGNDSNPPGGYCSRILSTGLQGGLNGRNFTIVATTYSQNNAGPLWLEVVFTNSTQGPCTPICEGHKCGSNGCGGVCNIVTCANGLSCNSGTCSDCPVNPPNCLHPPNSNFPAPYNGTYYQAECGEDLHHCGDSCGTCPTGSYCQLEMGICIPVAFCDHNVPKCSRPYPAPQRTKRDTFAGK